MAGAGGYDYEFVTTPPDRLVCKVCHNPCRDAHLTNCCGAHFCRSCLQQIRSGRSINRACPMCRAEGFDSFPNKEADREIKALHVYCVNENNGCTWSGEVKDAKRHFDAVCQFVDMPCPSRCGMKLKRQCIASHLAKDCPCHCQYCGFTGCKIDISTKHKKKCRKYPLPCPNGCELGVVPSAGMAAHRKVCPLEPVHCDYHDVGCHGLVMRRELVSHYTERMGEHLNLMKVKLTSTVEELNKSEKKLVSMEKELGRTKKSLHDTRLNYDKMSERISTTEHHLERFESRERAVDKNYMHDTSHDNSSHDNTSDGISTAMRTMLQEQDMKLSFITAFFRNYNLYKLVVMILFIVLYLIDSRAVNHRLSQIEGQMWLNSLDYFSELSASDNGKNTPFTFKIDEKPHSSVNFTLFPFNDEFKVLMTMKWDSNPSVSLSFKRDDLEKTSVKISEKMLTIELLNQLRNDDHFICPMIINIDVFTLVPKPCRISGDDTVVCTFHFMAAAEVKKREQYLHNSHLYFRVSQTKVSYLMWYVYAFCGPSILNKMLEYRASFIWFVIKMLVVCVFYTSEAWYNGQKLVFIFIPFLLSTIVMIDS